MMQYNQFFSDTRSGTDESGVALNALIRPCILQAFPLPAPDHPTDVKFELLLAALAQRRAETG